MEIVAAQPDTTPEQRDQIAKKLLGCSCNGQHPPAPSGCIACRVGSASKSMFGSIRRTLSAAAKMRKRLRMPRKNSAGRQQAPQVAMPRWSDPLSPSSRPAGYGEPCNASTSENYPELPSDPLCELQGSDAGALFAGAMPSQGMFIPNTTQPTHMSYPSPPSQSHYQRSHSGHSAFSGRTADRSVSMMSDSSDAIRGTPSLFSRLSQSTVSSGLTAISTNNVPRFDNDKDLVDSPVGMEETGAAELPPWGLETGLPRQVSWNSTSTTVDPAWAGDQGAPEPAEWFRPVPPSTRDTFPITTNERGICPCVGPRHTVPSPNSRAQRCGQMHFLREGSHSSLTPSPTRPSSRQPHPLTCHLSAEQWCSGLQA
ncbi:hypothetical protein QBC47DRAFT_3772 [Echria macrotheca]|uniref:Uncharacterized protein n=1 Tax=Echria macrotheca TaxID=438768 RepID=A0AAJ0FGP6_9PEZI|nr:hypothetical protein QBC47DRAFT_3772 [Echria macrotheca]